MSTAREVRITAYSEISNLSPTGAVEGDVEVTEEKALGTLFADGGSIVIKYETKSEGAEVRTELTLEPDSLRVKREGDVTSDFYFKENLEHASLYSVGQFSFDTTVKARKIRNKMTELGGRVDVFYRMTIGGADKEVRMKLVAE